MGQGCLSYNITPNKRDKRGRNFEHFALDSDLLILNYNPAFAPETENFYNPALAPRNYSLFIMHF